MNSLTNGTLRSKIITVVSVYAAIFCIGIFIYWILVNSEQTSDNNTADGFYIDSYNVELDVGENNEVYVTEKPTIFFTAEDKHGIFRFIPEWLEYTPKTNKTIKRKSVVKNIKSVGDEYSVDTINKKVRIKIGSAYEYVPYGDKEYTIKYIYDMGEDPYQGYDEFIFHVFGDYWGTPIKNGSVDIKMPKELTDYNINFFSDKYRKNNINNLIKYRLDSDKRTIHITTNDGYELSSSLTVDIELPEGYFVGGTNNYGKESKNLSLAAILSTLFIILMWVLGGKDYKKEVETVEFYPPENRPAAEIGYIYNYGQSNTKPTIATMIEMARKGYIKIDELEKDKIQITNLIKNETEDTFHEQIELKLLKPVDDSLTEEEKNVLASLKEGTDGKVSLYENQAVEKESTIKVLAEKKYLEILSNNIHDNVEEKSKVELNPYEQIVYDRLFSDGNITKLEDNQKLYKAFNEIENELNSKLKYEIYDKAPTFLTKLSIVMIGFITFASLVSFFLVADLNPKYSILYYISMACIPISIFFALFMARRTRYGELVTAKVNGFKNFLETAEKTQLESLVSQNKEYFYAILPYTYVLGVSSNWIKKFENIPIPEKDMGTFDYNDTSSYDNMSHEIHAAAPISTGSGGSWSSCGGGCSSCGGGCSSCGGGGSW